MLKILIFLIMFTPSIAFARELYIRVDNSDTIVDITTEQENLSNSRTGRVYKINSDKTPIYGDHYKNNALVFDSVKRTQIQQDIQKKQQLKETIRTKLKGLGLTNEETSFLLDN